MKTEVNSNTTSTNVWSSNEDLPHLSHEYLPVIGSCQVSSILSNLEEPDKILHQNVEIPQNMDLIVLQNSSFKLNEENIIENNLNSTEYVILKDNESSKDKSIDSTDNNLNKINSSSMKCSEAYIFCDLCPFLTLNAGVMSSHIENIHKNGIGVKLNKLKCPGCANIFYHRISLRSHLVYDHGIANPDLLKILQTVTFNAKKQGNNKSCNDNKPIMELEEFKTEIDIKNVICIPEKLPEPEAVPVSNPILPTVRVLNITELEEPKDVMEKPNPSLPPPLKTFNNYLKKSSPLTKPLIDKKNKCILPGCKIRLEDLAKMNYHIKCHLEHNYQCPECHSTFEFWNILAGHLWRNHKIDMELYSCDKCDYKTYSLAKLNNIHKLIHGDVKAYSCDSCKKSFKNSKQLRNHKITHKQKTEDSICFCEHCKKPFNNKRQLRIHIDGVHKKIKPFLCSFCGYKGATRGSLKSHIRQHTGEKPFACNSCTFTTSDHNSLRRHKLRHSGHKPYKCSHCDYACIQSSTYKVHLKTKHPGLEKELLFSCQECSFRTINKDIYTSHLLTVHKENQ